MSNKVDITVHRNSSYFRGWRFEDSECGAPINIDGWSFSLQVKSSATQSSPVIANAVFSDVVGRKGTVNVKIDGASFNGVSGIQEIVRLPYDLSHLTRTG